MTDTGDTNTVKKTGIQFLDDYYELVRRTEPSAIAHLWSLLTCASAAIEGRVYLPFGEGKILPHMYTLLYGDPASRKSSAMSSAVGVFKLSQYTKMVPERAKFQTFLDALPAYRGVNLGKSIMEDGPGDDYVHNCFMAADELTSFLGVTQGKNTLSTLGTLWETSDYQIYAPKKAGEEGKQLYNVSNPCITFLAGVTPESYDASLGAHAEDSGFISRLNIVVCERSANRVALPQPMDPRSKLKLLQHFNQIQDPTIVKTGPVTLSDEAKDLLTRIYKVDGVVDLAWRWRNYLARRYTHLLKLCIVLSCIKLSTIISADTVKEANSILHYTEGLLSRAIIDKSQSINAQAEKVILTTLASVPGRPYTLEKLRNLASPYVASINDIGPILQKLVTTGRIKEYVPKNNRSPVIAYVFPDAENKYHDTLLSYRMEQFLRT